MTNLIGFDKNRENVQFKGPCKLSVNYMSNFLYVEPKNEEFKLISASFEWTYVMKKNLLFVFAEFDFLDFCLEFKNEQMCKKISDYICSGKNYKEICESISCDDSFIKPIFQKIADNPVLNSPLKNVIAKWHQLLGEDEKEKYSNLMKNYDIFDLFSVAIQNQATQREEPNLEEMQNRKRRFRQIKKEEIFHEGDEKTTMKPSKEFGKFIAFSQIQLIYVLNSHHRTLLIYTSDQMDSFHEYRTKLKSKCDLFKCITCEKKAIIDVNEVGEFCVKMDSKEHSCKPLKNIPENSTNIKLLRKPDYELFEYCPGRSKKMLVIFDSADKNFCFEYYWCDWSLKFLCRGCCSMKIPNAVKSKAYIRNEGTEKEYVELLNENHQCVIRKYSLEKYAPIYDYVLKPYFEIRNYKRNGNELKKLLIFDPCNKTKYYQYYYHLKSKKFYCSRCANNKEWVTATLHRNSENVEYIILSNAKHVCEMRTFCSTRKIILLQSQDFEILEESKNQKIFVFKNSDRKNGYIFCKKRYSYFCRGCVSGKTHNCHRLSPFAGKLFKNEETGEYSFEMKPNQTHCCQPRPYEKYETISKTFDFFYFCLKSEQKTVKLAIQSSENNQLCFIFAYQKSSNFFVCIECRRMKKTYYIKLQKNDNLAEYFKHNIKMHICQPVKISSIPKFEILKESGIKFVSKPTSKIKFDENKIVKSPNFELFPNRNGVPDRKLIIFCSNDKTLCYEYGFDVSTKIFRCKRCKTKKTHVTAKLHKNDDKENEEESYIVMGKTDHVCQPVKYQPK